MARSYIVRGDKRSMDASNVTRIDAEKSSFEARLGQRISPMSNGCWLYRLDGDDYHACRRQDGTMTKAHRLVYEILVGPVPEGHHLHHTCRTKGCVNPSHLEAVTPLEHSARHR